MGKIYKTAQGRQLDMEKLRLQNELVPAVGNMRVNARGDQLGAGGAVVKSREAMLDDHYRTPSARGSGKRGADNIPTSSGKAKRVEKFAAGSIEADVAGDEQTSTVESETTPVKKSTKAVKK